MTDKGYHSNDTMTAFRDLGIRTYASEPNRGRRNWKQKPDEKAAVYANRRRIRGERGKRLLRQRGLILERPFAHTLETGGLRRVHLRYRENILKRVLIQYAALNPSLLLRHNFGKGTPRGLQDRCAATVLFLMLLVTMRARLIDPDRSRIRLLGNVVVPRSSICGERNITSASGC